MASLPPPTIGGSASQRAKSARWSTTGLISEDEDTSTTPGCGLPAGVPLHPRVPPGCLLVRAVGMLLMKKGRRLIRGSVMGKRCLRDQDILTAVALWV